MLKLPFEKLLVWQKAMDFVELVYVSSEQFPQHERFGLIAQLRKAAVSVPSNIAEGSQRSTDKDFRNFLLIAKGSLAEVTTQFLLAKRLKYCNEVEVNAIVAAANELHKMLYAFSEKLLPKS